jgi:hypothetical protein
LILKKCDLYSTSYFFHSCLDYAREHQRWWYEAALASLSPELAFGAESRIPIRLAGVFARDSERVRAWLEVGSRGELGGSPGQILQAISTSLTLQADGEERLRYIESVINSPFMPPSGGAGSRLAGALLWWQSWPNGTNTSAALHLLSRLLHDSRFEVSAARKLLADYKDEPADEYDAQTWRSLRERARSVVAAAGYESR